MTTIPKPSMEAVYDRYGLRVIGQPNGAGWTKAECPLPDHEDRNPSARIHEDECRWHCFTCDQGGDAVDLILRREPHAGWPGAVKVAQDIAEHSGGDVRDSSHGAGSSELLPRRQKRDGSRGAFVPPWLRR